MKETFQKKEEKNLPNMQVIRFKGRGRREKRVVCGIAATRGKQFIVDWGDGSPAQTMTGKGKENYLRIYADAKPNQVYNISITGATSDCLFTTFYCQGCGITNLNLSECTTLKELDCSYNELTALTLNKNTALKHLDCSYNQLTTLNLSKNTVLENLDCFGNRFLYYKKEINKT